MKNKQPPPFLHPAVILSTWFGSGYLRPAPGTWGTLAALPFAWGIHYLGGQAGLAVCALLAYAIGTWSAHVYSRLTDSHDASEVVIDEVAGVWLAFAFVPLSFVGLVIAFLLFRIADILKPWPASWADRSLGGGFGIMTDDMIAGLYAGGVTYAIMQTEWIADVSF